MSIKAFVYVEMQNSVSFAQFPWRELGLDIAKQPGFINKTWLSGVGSNSVGGFYVFNSIENAQKYVTGFLPEKCAAIGVAHGSRIFNADIVEEASRDMGSVHFGAKLKAPPGAFVYTEVQISVPFENAPWREINPILKKQSGILAKTWASGLHTNTAGGFYAFDTIEHAQAFAVNYFPTEGAKMNAAFTTRIFDGTVVKDASKQLNSPFYV